MQITGRPEPYRRPSRTTTQIKSRPDRVAFWAVLLGVFMVFMAVVTAQADAAKWQRATLGDRTLSKGTAGNDVKTLQMLLTRRGFEVPSTGYFGTITKRKVSALPAQPRPHRRRHRRPDDAREVPPAQAAHGDLVRARASTATRWRAAAS